MEWLQKIKTFFMGRETVFVDARIASYPTAFLVYRYGGRCSTLDIITWAVAHTSWHDINVDEQVVYYIRKENDLAPVPDIGADESV